MKKIEYLTAEVTRWDADDFNLELVYTVSYGRKEHTYLNSLGREGWELVSISELPQLGKPVTVLIAIFKREV